MNIQLERLISLQNLDFQIVELKKSLEIIPGQISNGLKELEGKKSKLNSLKEEIDSLKKKRLSLE